MSSGNRYKNVGVSVISRKHQIYIPHNEKAFQDDKNNTEDTKSTVYINIGNYTSIQICLRPEAET